MARSRCRIAQVTTSETPFRRGFWVGEVDARIPALFRMVMGSLILIDLGDRLRDFHTFYTDWGLLPRASAALDLYHWSVFAWSGRPAAVAAIYAAGVVVAVAFTVGFHTRPATVLTWIFIVSLQNRNGLVLDGSDTVVKVLLFWGMFADLGSAFSLDVRRGRRPARRAVPALPVRCMQIQVAIVYIFTGLDKNGPHWMDGTAVFHALQNLDLARPTGRWLTAWPGLSRLFTWGTLVTELGFAPLVFSPVRTSTTRAVGLLLATAMHTGIFVLLRVGWFSPVMIGSYTLFLMPEWIDRVLGPSRAPEAPAFQPRPWQRLVGCFLFAELLMVTSTQFTSLRRIPWVNQPVRAHLRVLSLLSNWGMFAPEPPTRNGWWSAPGTLADGRPVEVLEAALPQLLPDTRMGYSRWHKLRNDLSLGQHSANLILIARYLCNRYNSAAAGPRLERFTLVFHHRSTRLPGGSDPPSVQEDFVNQRCGQ
jgi:hypothetical protein